MTRRCATTFAPLADLLEAAERCPLRRIALNRISDALLFPHHHTSDRLMRQVQDDARWHYAG